MFSLYLVVMPLTENADIGLAYAFAFLVLGLLVFFLFKFIKDRVHCCGEFEFTGFIAVVSLSSSRTGFAASESLSSPRTGFTDVVSLSSQRT